MSEMSNLDARLREAGIDPEGVDIPAVAYLMMIHQYKTGNALTFVEAAVAIAGRHTGDRRKSERVKDDPAWTVEKRLQLDRERNGPRG